MTERPSTTEDVPATPGWVEGSVDEILGSLPRRPSLAGLRNAYLDCLAAARGPADIDDAHDRCRLALIAGLRDGERIDEPLLAELNQRLEALEAAITEEV